jgi:hypothetical protein
VRCTTVEEKSLGRLQTLCDGGWLVAILVDSAPDEPAPA